MNILKNLKTTIIKLITMSAFCYPLLFQSIDVLAQTRPPPEPPREEVRTEPETRRTEGETRPGIGGRPTQEGAIRRWVAGQPPQVEVGSPSGPRNPNIPLRLEPATPPSVGYRPPSPQSLPELRELHRAGRGIREDHPTGPVTYRMPTVRARLQAVPSPIDPRMPPLNPPANLPVKYRSYWDTYYRGMLDMNGRTEFLRDPFYRGLHEAYWNGSLFQYLEREAESFSEQTPRE